MKNLMFDFLCNRVLLVEGKAMSNFLFVGKKVSINIVLSLHEDTLLHFIPI